MATTYDKASLVMIPSGYKDDKLYSVKPTDGSGDFTFSRDGSGASPATRVNASGLIEKGRENKLTYSNDFSNAAWSKINTSVTGGQSGYDGSNDAWLLSKSATAGYLNQGLSGGSLHTFSVYAKAGSLNWIAIQISGSPSPYAYFDLQNGVVGSTIVLAIDANIESIGSGWYRISVVGSNTGFNGVNIYPADADGDLTGTSGNIYIQDAQVEQGLVATDYIETTTAPVSAGLLGDMPRLDYSGGATCPSLLLEPSRVNSLPYSEYFGAWDGFNASISDNQTTSPEGVINAAKITEDSSNAFHDADLSYVFPAAAHTFSVFVKANGRSVIFLQQFDGGTFHSSNNFDLSAGTYAGGSEGKIEDYGNGWYRCSFTATTAAGTGKVYINLHNGTSGNYQGDGTSGVFVYGAQLEASASYPTSYIPTYGSASTRGADSCSKTGISSLIGQTEGTLFIDVNIDDVTSQLNDPVLCYMKGTNVETYIEFYDNRSLLGLHYNGSTQASILVPNKMFDGQNKIAFAYKENDFVLYLNGNQIGTDTSGSVGAQNEFGFQYYNSVYNGKQNINQALVFKTRLTNAELAALTTL